MQMRRFEYVPAAITGRPPNTFCGIKLEDNRGKDRLWKRTRWNGITVHYLPDRTVYFGASRKGANGIYDVDYDVFFIMSPTTHPEVLNNAGYNYAMASPLHVSNDTETRRNPHVKLFSDSGGFQLFSGALDWIDMDQLVEFYNRTVDYGIGLDIPTGGPQQKKFLMRMCEVMLKNNRYMRDRCIPEVEIYDVSHGNTLTLRQQFINRVLEDKKAEKREGGGLAVAGIAQNMADGGAAQTIINGTVNLLYTLLKSKGQYERYHILGTTNSFFQFMYHILLAHDVAPYITADSTSYVLPSANNLIMDMRLEPNHALVSTTIPKTNNSFFIRCSCPVCSTLKYSREFHVNYLANVIHSLYAIANQRDRIEETALDYMGGAITLNQALTTVTGDTNVQRLGVFAAAVKFAEHAAKKGFKDAWSVHEGTLKHLMRDGISKASLFGEHPVDSATKERAARLDMILGKFEDFHSKQKRGRK